MAEKISTRPATITIKDGKVLLVNSNYNGEQFYLFPGGGIEFGETAEQCAIRETLEETGIKIKIKNLIHVNEYIYANDWNKRSINLFFISEFIKKTKPKTNDHGKIKQIEWIKVEELEKYKIKPKRMIPIIKEYIKTKEPRLTYSIDFKN